MPPVALLTDFGHDDHYVGVVHAVLERECPGVARVDLGHALPAGDIWSAAFQLRCAWPHLPSDCVVLAVIDPGVGTSRRAVVVEVDGRYLVAPDNGLAAAVGSVASAVELDWRLMGLAKPSATFHGRDLFAPAAARLAAGGSMSDLGAEIDGGGLVPCPLPEPRRSDGGLDGVILVVDRFGNLATNVREEERPGLTEARWRADRTARRVTTYAEGAPDEVVLLEGSAGYLELAVNCGSAAEATGLERGDVVLLR
ncbi:MAG: SAM-dependent chlorinase/fluorinase [Holophagae bacterium]|jgi:S-adenosylmethionine hydrolase